MRAVSRPHSDWRRDILSHDGVACGDEFSIATVAQGRKAAPYQYHCDKMAEDGVLLKSRKMVRGNQVVRYRLVRHSPPPCLTGSWRTFPNSDLPDYPVQFGAAR